MYTKEISARKLPFTFPVTEKEFTAFQEQLLKRKITNSEGEFVSLFVDVLNTIYNNGLDERYIEYLDDMAESWKESEKDCCLIRAIKAWLFYAQQQREAAML